MKNVHKFARTIIDGEKFLEATHNQYLVVGSRPYADKKGVLPDGYTLTLQIRKDDMDYGVDKDGNPRENNVYENFDATVLSRKKPAPKKGDFVKLVGFDEEHSFLIDYNLILRFADFEQLKVTKSNGD